MAGKYERELVVMLKPGAAEQIDGRVFEASFGDAELELHQLLP